MDPATNRQRGGVVDLLHRAPVNRLEAHAAARIRTEFDILGGAVAEIENALVVAPAIQYTQVAIVISLEFVAAAGILTKSDDPLREMALPSRPAT